MRGDPLLQRLSAAAPRTVPDPDALLERAFPEGERRAPRQSLSPLATAAGVALVVAASTPVWVEPSEAERERTEALITAAVKTWEHCARELNPGGND